MDFTHNSPERKLKPCVMPTCKDRRFDLVHKFPMDNERAKQWLEIIDIPELTALPLVQLRKRCFICSKHFRKQDYKNCESRSLNKTAYPRLHLKADNNSSEDIESVYIISDDANSQTSVDTILRGPEEENRSTIGTDSFSIANKTPQIRFILDSSSNNISNSPIHEGIDDADNVVTKKFRLIEKPSVAQSRSMTAQLKKRTELSGLTLKKQLPNMRSEEKIFDQWDDDTGSLNENVNVYKKTTKQTSMLSVNFIIIA